MEEEKNPPAFQFYPRDFLTDENQIMMNLEQSGAYIRLLCHCWIKRSLPNDLKVLQKLCDYVGEKFEHQIWDSIKHCFQERDGRLFHKRLEYERAKQIEYSEMQSEKGKFGNKIRWGNRRVIAEQSQSDSGVIADDRSRLVSSRLNLVSSQSQDIKALSSKLDVEAPVVYLNQQANRRFDPKNKAVRRFVEARYAEGRTLDDFKKVIDKKVLSWQADDKMSKFLRPSTLFNATNFENYLNEPEDADAKFRQFSKKRGSTESDLRFPSETK